MNHQPGYTYGQVAYNPMIGSNAGPPHQKTAQIQAWAVHASGSRPDHPTMDFQNHLAFSNDEAWTGPDPHGYLSHSNSSDGSDLVNSVPMERMDLNNFSQSGASSEFQSPDFDMLGKSHGTPFVDQAFHPDAQPFPCQENVSFPLSPSNQAMLQGDSHNGTFDPNQGYLLPSPNQSVTPDMSDGNYYPGWNQDSASSLSSYVPDTPVSLSLEDPSFMAPQFCGNGSNQLPLSMMTHTDAQRFVVLSPANGYCSNTSRSTVRPVPMPSRNSLPEEWMQPNLDVPAQPGSPVSTFPHSRRSSDSEPLSARRDPLYQLQPRKKDGYYKCIFEENGKVCDYEPFKLKCNYE